MSNPPLYGLVALLILAMRANAGDFDDRHLWREAGRARGGGEALCDRCGRDFADQAAALADQEGHHRGLVMIMRTGKKGVAAFDAVDEAVFHQKIERAIDRDRRRPRFRLRQFLDHLIGTERPVAGQQGFQHVTADRREFLRALGADPLGMAQSVRRAAAVIVTGGRKGRFGEPHGVNHTILKG